MKSLYTAIGAVSLGFALTIFMIKSTEVRAIASVTANPAENPLTAKWTGPHGGLPPFDKVKLADFKPALEMAMAENLAEIDKIASRSEMQGADVSRQGVQRDLLPLVEGTTVNTKFGTVRTDHILFIASGAFHLAKPSDLIPELQGRFPIRVELAPLTKDDFVRILTEPRGALVRQYQALMATEGLAVEFAADGVAEIAATAVQVKERTENIGARRLFTIMERLLEQVSFEGSELQQKTVVVDAGYVRERLLNIVKDQDLSRYIL